MRMHNPPHPGEILKEEVLPELGLTVGQLAEHLGVSRPHLSRALNAGVTSCNTTFIAAVPSKKGLQLNQCIHLFHVHIERNAAHLDRSLSLPPVWTQAPQDKTAPCEAAKLS